MEDIFISYSRKDRSIVRSLSKKLEAQGYSVWWDESLRAGDSFHESLTQKVNQVKVVIVIWSEDSTKSLWVLAEASVAFDQSKLLPIKVPSLDPAAIPLPFNSIHAVDVDELNLIIESLGKMVPRTDVQRQKSQRITRNVKRLRIFCAALVLLLLGSATVTYFSVPTVKALVNSLVRRTFDIAEPCKGLRVTFGAISTEESICVDPDDPHSTRFQDCDTCPPLVVLPRGEAQIGSPPEEIGRDTDEEPQKTVVLEPFAVGVYEVRRKDWDECVKAKGCPEKRSAQQANLPDLPVSGVSWTEAKHYLAWLTEKTDRPYRLLSETEWEYAARAGSLAPRPWGYEERDACQFANVGDETGAPLASMGSDTRGRPQDMSIELSGQHTCSDEQPLLAEVGTFMSNNFGLYDMIGNVWEWVEDCHFPNLEETPRDGSARFEQKCRVHVVRGGSYLSGPASARSANRFQGGRAADVQQADIGFRVARDVTAPDS